MAMLVTYHFGTKLAFTIGAASADLSTATAASVNWQAFNPKLSRTGCQAVPNTLKSLNLTLAQSS